MSEDLLDALCLQESDYTNQRSVAATFEVKLY